MYRMSVIVVAYSLSHDHEINTIWIIMKPYTDICAAKVLQTGELDVDQWAMALPFTYPLRCCTVSINMAA